MNLLLVCSAVLMILYSVLSFNVSRARVQFRDSKISPEDLNLIVRNQGNASEYIPLFVAVSIYLSISPSNWFVSIVAITATASRVLHAIGMHLMEDLNQRHPLRFFGALGTYLSIFAFGCILLVGAF